jgi:Gnt-I system low-affinity gluconate transporter
MAYPILGTCIGIALLLLLILRFKIPAFIALLMASIVAGLLAGLSGIEMVATISEGMGSTLGFVATVVGLGAMFGAILEHAGGAQAVAQFLLRRLGVERAPRAMVITGFIVAIPVFFDVAFIILVPLVYALQQKTGKSLLLYAIPLLAGLAATHAFIPPTPGPIAVADIVGADLGWVIMLGVLAGFPSVLIAGLLFGKRIARRIHIELPDHFVAAEEEETTNLPSLTSILLIIALPIILILLNTVGGSLGWSDQILSVLAFIGHPFIALLIANLLVWYVLGIRRGSTSKELLKITSKSMGPAGTIILLTGAGGVFKQTLVDTKAGELIATQLADLGLPLIVFAFLAAALVRIAQGSATVAMITGASLVAPLLSSTAGLSAGQLAAIVIAIAAGATALSHVNDSGFWLVKEYLGMDERQTFRSWTMMTVWLGLSGFVLSAVLFALL